MPRESLRSVARPPRPATTAGGGSLLLRGATAMIALLWNACTTHAGAPKTHVVGAAQVASSPSLDARVATAVADEEREVRVLIEGAHEVRGAARQHVRRARRRAR